nr:UDP-N-acetylglucosamine 1-carboxyvinyltransferase [Candidatus Gracilibacteria bacterium]
LPIIGACLLAKGESILTNVPDISDIHTLCHILEYLGCRTSYENEALRIDTSTFSNKEIPHEMVSKMRGCITLLGPILGRYGEAAMAFPGGCVLGKRPIDTHLIVMEELGGEVIDRSENIKIRAPRLKGKTFVMPEMSVTATENAIMAAVLAEGKSEIRLCAAEPHVQDLCQALNAAGAKIEGIGTHNLSIQGVSEIKPIKHRICPDYLEIGTYAIAAAVTNGHILIKEAVESHLDIFWLKMKEAGVKFEHRANEVEIWPSKENLRATNIRTAVFPSFATDLHPQFTMLLTQCYGESVVFETLFEGKMNYIFELIKMGANIELLNNHQARVIGPKELKGTTVTSLDIRAGATMILAGLAASGETEVANVYYIDRGYSNLVEKLTGLGADIQRIND